MIVQTLIMKWNYCKIQKSYIQAKCTKKYPTENFQKLNLGFSSLHSGTNIKIPTKWIYTKSTGLRILGGWITFRSIYDQYQN